MRQKNIYLHELPYIDRVKSVRDYQIRLRLGMSRDTCRLRNAIHPIIIYLVIIMIVQLFL